jgi:hypothetical protein
MQIGEDVIQEISEQVSGLLSDYKKEINEAYLKTSNSLTVDLSVKFTPEDSGGVYVETGISFVKDRVKAKTSGSVIEGQMKLDLEGPGETDEPSRFCPVQGERVRESFCYEKCDLRLEVLAPDPENYPDFLQARPCAAHADEWTAFCVQMMLKWEPPPYYAEDPPAPDEVEEAEKAERESQAEKNFYRIQHKKTGEWWEGWTDSPASACILAGWNAENCEVKVRTMGEHATGWAKVDPQANPNTKDPDPCTGCTHHRRKGNPKKGVTIPGVYGKCIREGGLCQEMAERSVEVAA